MVANDWVSGRRLNAPLKASAFDAAYTFSLSQMFGMQRDVPVCKYISTYVVETAGMLPLCIIHSPDVCGGMGRAVMITKLAITGLLIHLCDLRTLILLRKGVYCGWLVALLE